MIIIIIVINSLSLVRTKKDKLNLTASLSQSTWNLPCSKKPSQITPGEHD